MAGQSVTVTVGDHDMTFRIDNKTMVEARGGSTKTAQAAANGKPGVHIDEVLKPGQAVAVTYHDMDGVVPGDGYQGDSQRPSSEHAGSPTGVVKAIGTDWITINGKSGGGASFEQTLKIDSKTMVLAKGAGTAVAAKGGRAPFTDLVHSGDHVSVSYHKVGDGLLASDLRVTHQGAVAFAAADGQEGHPSCPSCCSPLSSSCPPERRLHAHRTRNESGVGQQRRHRMTRPAARRRSLRSACRAARRRRSRARSISTRAIARPTRDRSGSASGRKVSELPIAARQIRRERAVDQDHRRADRSGRAAPSVHDIQRRIR